MHEPQSLSQVSGKRQSVVWMGRQPASFPTGQAGRTEFHGVTELCCTQASWPNCPQCTVVLQREFKMSIYISAQPGEVCRNSARLLAMHCTSAAPDIIRINPSWEHGAEALPLQALEEDPADWLQTPLVQSKVSSIKLYLKNHTNISISHRTRTKIGSIVPEEMNFRPPVWLQCPVEQHFSCAQKAHWALVKFGQWPWEVTKRLHLNLTTTKRKIKAGVALSVGILIAKLWCSDLDRPQSYRPPFLFLFSTSKGFNWISLSCISTPPIQWFLRHLLLPLQVFNVSSTLSQTQVGKISSANAVAHLFLCSKHSLNIIPSTVYINSFRKWISFSKISLGCLVVCRPEITNRSCTNSHKQSNF